jgi:hypothetical protein
VNLASLAGTYRWIYLTQTSWEPVEFRYESDPEVLKNTFPGFPGFLKISFPEDEKPSLDNIKGEFHLRDIKGSFIGVRPRKNRAGEVTAGAWSINEVEWDPEHRRGTYGITTGHEMEISDVVDDNGNRFVTLVRDQGYSGCCPHYADWVGRKQSDNEALVGLTDAETKRLGMYLTEEEVKNLKQGAGQEKKEEEADTKRKADDDDERDPKRKRED